MSTSVIASARQGTSSLFNVVTRSSETLVGLLDAASATVDLLNIKAKDAHHSAVFTSRKERIFTEDRITMEVILRHVDLQEEFHKRNWPDKDFDRDAAIKLATTKLESAT